MKSIEELLANGKKAIKKSDWFPDHDPLDYPQELVDFIDSINNDWRQRKRYKKFDLWKKQAEQWLEEPELNLAKMDYDEQMEYIMQEYTRCRDNTLYFANRYGWLGEGSIDDARVKYKAWPAQELILFLIDSGYNVIIGKPRQVGFTSTMGLVAIKRLNFHKNFFTKFVTHSFEKGKEIFRDKIKWPFTQLPDWFQNAVFNDSDSEISLLEKAKKGKLGGMNSRLKVDTPTEYSINGGSPNLVLIDEIGLFECFGAMMREGRPTLFMFNPINRRQEMRRQLVAWGTGSMENGPAFESQFEAAFTAWQERNFGYGIIPIFFNAFAREGVDEAVYKKEKQVAYSVKGPEAEKARVQFHQAYPLTRQDMFLRSSRTIIPVDLANQHLLKIYNVPLTQRPQYGYFEPIYDISKPTDDPDIPYRIIGSTWIPTGSMVDPRTTTVIWRHPKAGWEYRYYQGTDPINSETGHSNMSSAIWDAHEQSIAAVVNYRERKFKLCYVQCLCLKLYYDKNGRIRELIENNTGDFYNDFLERHGYRWSVVAAGHLPPVLQTQGKPWGISNKTHTADKIFNKMMELVDNYLDNIYIEWFFVQCKTFVEKELKNPTNSSRTVRYQAQDLKVDFDDVLFSSTFAYICAVAFAKYEPTEVAIATKSGKTHKRYVQTKETGFQLRLAEVTDNGKVVRYL